MIIMQVKTVTETFHLSSYDSTNSVTVGEVSCAETGPIETSIVGYDYNTMYYEGTNVSIFRDSLDNAKNGLQSEWNIFYDFDLSDIPEDAIIKSVSCDVLGFYKVFGQMNSPDPNNQKEIVCPIPRVATLQLYNGIGKPKGNIHENCYLIDIPTILHDSAAIEKKYKKIFSLDCGEWTREELKDCKLNMHVIREVDQNYIIDGVDRSDLAHLNFCNIMAADLTVEYEAKVPVSKVVFGGNTLIDLTGDTVCPEMLTGGITAHDMSGKLITGKMPNRGSITGIISTIFKPYKVQRGYHDGTGTVGIDPFEQDKLISKNIRSGVEILGIIGTMPPGKTQQIVKGDNAKQLTDTDGYKDNFLPANHFGIPSLTVEEFGTYVLKFSFGTTHADAVSVKLYNSTQGKYLKDKVGWDIEEEIHSYNYYWEGTQVYLSSGDEIVPHFKITGSTTYAWVWCAYLAIEKI